MKRLSSVDGSVPILGRIAAWIYTRDEIYGLGFYPGQIGRVYNEDGTVQYALLDISSHKFERPHYGPLKYYAKYVKISLDTQIYSDIQ